MDFKTYITKVEEQLKQMTEAEKTDWIYALARKVDEKDRQNFLNSLYGKKEIHMKLTKEEILDWCQKVEEGEIYLEGKLSEYYEERGWGSDWIVEYHDTFGAMPYLTKAIDTCSQLVEKKEYASAYQLLDRICGLEFRAEYNDDYGYEDYDEDGLTLENLVKEELLILDFRKLSLNLLYTCYQTNTGQDRLERLYEYLTWRMTDKILITDIFAFGPEEIKDATMFMQEWYAYLIQISEDRAAELLVDACIYLGGDEYLLKTAGEYAKLHPFLYQAYCEKKYQLADYQACIEAAKEALDRIDGNKVIRSAISDIAVMAAKKADMDFEWKHFYFAAFYSNPNSWHLLRLYKLKDSAVLKEALERIERLPVGSQMKTGNPREQREVLIDDNMQTIYQFLLGDYDNVLRQCRQDKKYLGWSYGKKPMIILLLLIYLKKDEKQKTVAERNLIEELNKRLNFNSKEEELFSEYISIWRQSYHMPKEQEEACIKWLSEEVDKRTEGIVGGGHRGSYYKAAELIVVMGEIQEERGEVGGMRRLIDYYKRMHSRKTAFKSEIEGLAKKY